MKRPVTSQDSGAKLNTHGSRPQPGRALRGQSPARDRHREIPRLEGSTPALNKLPAAVRALLASRQFHVLRVVADIQALHALDHALLLAVPALSPCARAALHTALELGDELMIEAIVAVQPDDGEAVRRG